MTHHAKALGRILGVGLDLRLLGKQPTPAGVGGKRVGIERRGHVAAAIGVGVVTPHTADFFGLLQHQKITAGLAQPDGGADTGKAGADHDHFMGCVSLPGWRGCEREHVVKTQGTPVGAIQRPLSVEAQRHNQASEHRQKSIPDERHKTLPYAHDHPAAHHHGVR